MTIMWVYHKTNVIVSKQGIFLYESVKCSGFEYGMMICRVKNLDYI